MSFTISDSNPVSQSLVNWIIENGYAKNPYQAEYIVKGLHLEDELDVERAHALVERYRGIRVATEDSPRICYERALDPDFELLEDTGESCYAQTLSHDDALNEVKKIIKELGYHE